MGEHRGQRLQTPVDVRRAVQRISNKIFREGSEVENAGRLAQLYNVFLKSWELDKLSDIEKRLTAVEEAQRNEKR
jgi:hypothetical protein